MKNTFHVLLLTLLITLKAAAQDTGIHFFKGTWAEALELSKKENKMIFMDCNTTWCGPCKVLAAKIFPQLNVAGFYNTNFINISMDMEKGEGPALARNFNIKSYPTMLFLKPGGYKVDALIGLTTADSLIMAGKAALGKAGQLTAEEQFYKGPRTAEMVRKYFTNIVMTGGRGQELAPIDTIIKQEGFDAFYQQKYWDLLPIVNVNSLLGIWFVKNRLKFNKIYGEDVVNARISEMYTSYTTLSVFSRLKNVAAFDKIKAVIADRGLADQDFLNAEIDFYINCKARNIDKAFEIADRALVNAKPWQYYEMAKWANWMAVGGTTYRARAVKWAAKASAELKNKTMKEESLHILDDLMNRITPTVYPSPKMYNLNV